MASVEITVVTKPTKAQLARSFRHQILSRPTTRVIVALGFVGPFLFFAYTFLRFGVAPPMDSFIPLMFLCFAFSLLILYGNPAMMARHPAAKATLAGEMKIRFSTTGVAVQANWGNAEVQWSAFTSAVRLGDCYALYAFKASTGYIIPRSDFASPAEDASFVALVRDKLGAAAKL